MKSTWLVCDDISSNVLNAVYTVCSLIWYKWNGGTLSVIWLGKLIELDVVKPLLYHLLPIDTNLPVCTMGGLSALLWFMFSFLKMQNNSNNPTASQGPATSESNNLPLGRPSSGSAFGKPKGTSGGQDVQFMDQPLLVRGDSMRTATATKADMELLARNRGNAMQRYKEKKKTRRYVFLC